MKKCLCLLLLLSFLPVASAAEEKADAYYQDFVVFLDLSGAEKMQRVMLQKMFDQFKQMPGVDAGVFDDMAEIMDREIAELNKKLFPVYKKHISHEDLKDIIAFYKSPAGKRMTVSQPLIMKESFDIGAEWGRGVAARVLGK